MTYWQVWMACGLLMTLPAAAQADIFRWDNGQLIPGTEGITPGPGVYLDSRFGEWNSAERNLRFGDFSGGLDLTGASFSLSWLDDSRFNGANLTRAMLGGASLTNADLSGANLTGADLGSRFFGYGAATLTNANLAGAMVTGASFYLATSRGFTKEQLYSTASYQQRNLRGIELGGNNLTGGDFSGQDLTFAGFYSSTLTNSNLAGAVVAGADFSDTTSRGFTKEQLYSTTSYQQGNLRGIRLWNNDLTGWDFSGLDLTGAGFRQSTLTNANLAGANLTSAALAAANLANANLSGTNLTNASLEAATLTSANFAGAVVAGANLARVFYPPPRGSGITLPQLYSTASYQQRDLRGIVLFGNDLTDGDFSGQDLAGANLVYSTLTNANLAGANLTNAGLQVAALTNANLAGAMVTEASFGSTTSSGFDSGVPALNDWLQKLAGQHERRDLARTYVAVLPDDKRVLGYYALSNHRVSYDALPEDQAKGLPRIDVPVVLLGRLAVDRSAQGQGPGEFLLIDALRRASHIAEQIGVRAVEVDALDDLAKNFYLKYGFVPLLDDPRHLFLPMQVIRKLRLSPF